MRPVHARQCGHGRDRRRLGLIKPTASAGSNSRNSGSPLTRTHSITGSDGSPVSTMSPRAPGPSSKRIASADIQTGRGVSDGCLTALAGVQRLRAPPPSDSFSRSGILRRRRTPHHVAASISHTVSRSPGVTRLTFDKIAPDALHMEWREAYGLWKLVLPVGAVGRQSDAGRQARPCRR
jgi:hypothetical protein